MTVIRSRKCSQSSLAAFSPDKGACFYQTVAADWIAGAGMPVAVAAGTRAQVGAAGDALEPGGAHLTGQAGVACRASGNSADW